MTIEDLYQELDMGFGIEERPLFLRELASAAEEYSGTLEAGRTRSRRTKNGEQIQSLVKELEGETVDFSPVLDIYPLSKKTFKEHGLDVPAGLAARLREYTYYLVNVPVTLVAAPGWGFNQLECILEFNPDSPAQARPIAYQVFPKEEWEPIVRAGQHLSVGLDENLEFKTPEIKLQPMLSAGVDLVTRAGAGLVLGPFQYQVLRAKVISRGVGNVKVRWRLEGEEAFQKADPRLGIVLQVPKGLERVVILGVLKASKDFHLLTSHLRHVLQYVRDRTRRYIDQGAPVVNHMTWDFPTRA